MVGCSGEECGLETADVEDGRQVPDLRVSLCCGIGGSCEKQGRAQKK